MRRTRARRGRRRRRARLRARRPGGARGAWPLDENRTVRAVEVLAPRSLDEALRLKAEHPDAVSIQGGTDVMVALNFDRLRPARLLNLNEVRDLRGWSRENGSLRLGSGLTYTEAMTGEPASLVPALAEAARTVGSAQIRHRGTIGRHPGDGAHRRLAADPQPRHDRRQPGHGVAGGRRAAPARRRGRGGGVRIGARDA